MCEPMTIAAVTMAVASVGSAVAGHQGAKAQQKMQDYQYEQNRLNSMTALRHNYSTTQQRQFQEAEAASQQIQERRREALKQTASASVAAGESGITGLSVESVLRDIGAAASRDVSTIEQNRDWNIDQLNQQMLGQQAQAKSRSTSVMPGQSVSPWPYAFQAAQGASSAFSIYKQGQAKSG